MISFPGFGVVVFYMYKIVVLVLCRHNLRHLEECGLKSVTVAHTHAYTC